MSVLGWMAATGFLLLFMALSSAHVQRLPVSTSVIYLLVGVAVGPAGFGVLRIDLRGDGAWFETLTEVALIISLFVGGLKLRLPLRHPAWIPAVRLAGPVMLASILGVAIASHLLLGLTPTLALLLGAILAPTDPVLASAVAVSDAADHDVVRYGLSGEAGLNDGAAFPFVVLALLAIEHGGPGDWLARWAVERLLWAVPVGIAVGYAIGRSLGKVAMRLRTHHRDTGAPSDFLALAVIALSYVTTETLHGWGFLAAFAAGVGLRHAELQVVAESPHPATTRSHFGSWVRERPPVASMAADPRATIASPPSAQIQSPLSDPAAPGPADTAGEPTASPPDAEPVAHPPAETLVPPTVDEKALAQPAVAAGVLIAETLSFGDTMERMLEVMLVVLVGIMLVDAWTPSALPLAALLFFVIRPGATLALLAGTRATHAQRWLMGWFGLRGIGSLYYLSYALHHEPSRMVEALIGPTLTVVACSIVVHGISVTPILNWYERRLERAGAT